MKKRKVSDIERYLVSYTKTKKSDNEGIPLVLKLKESGRRLSYTVKTTNKVAKYKGLRVSTEFNPVRLSLLEHYNRFTLVVYIYAPKTFFRWEIQHVGINKESVFNFFNLNKRCLK